MIFICYRVLKGMVSDSSLVVVFSVAGEPWEFHQSNPDLRLEAQWHLWSQWPLWKWKHDSSPDHTARPCKHGMSWYTIYWKHDGAYLLWISSCCVYAHFMPHLYAIKINYLTFFRLKLKAWIQKLTLEWSMQISRKGISMMRRWRLASVLLDFRLDIYLLHLL